METFSSFVRRHVGLREDEVSAMVTALGYESLDSFISNVVPQTIFDDYKLSLKDLPCTNTEEEALACLKTLASKNEVFRSFIGGGYFNTHLPSVILRNVFENPGWYTQYTPYQPEVSQGRLEALLNYQTTITELTGLPISNASLLDEGTAAAEALVMVLANQSDKPVFVSNTCFPQTISVVKNRLTALGITVEICSTAELLLTPRDENAYQALLIQTPDAQGVVHDIKKIREQNKKIPLVVATDLYYCTVFTPPGEAGADIVVGSSQRFGVPLGFGGPHAAFISCKEEYVRKLPGRIVGVSKDSHGNSALRLSLQTREQHIRREKATSNICTSQVLLAVIAGMYAVYHGPKILREKSMRALTLASSFRELLSSKNYKIKPFQVSDVVYVEAEPDKLQKIKDLATAKKINLGFDSKGVRIAFDETISFDDFYNLCVIFELPECKKEFFSSILSDAVLEKVIKNLSPEITPLLRKSSYLNQDVFHKYRSETEMLRYIKKLESKDLSLCQSMIPLGSCTMKLNASSEMLPVTWPEFSSIHPLAPNEQVQGYLELAKQLENSLAEITGFDAVSLQPNAGSQGEYAGLLAIKAYFEEQNEHERNICLIPKSAHGTNPASAVMAGFVVVSVACDETGDIDLQDLKAKVATHTGKVAVLMVTYPSTHGVFEDTIKEVTQIVHEVGGQVYMDGANLNALVGLVRPAELGMDVCHINLHKTFCIPHGGGGPGVGPIAVASHLSKFLPSKQVETWAHNQADIVGPVCSAPYGSASILVISWMYMCMMRAEGLVYATKTALLNANYIAHRLKDHFPVLFTGKSGLVAHECVLDCRHLKPFGIEVEDIAKRLMDYGFHAPTVSWPVPGTIMVEPTESEGKAELDRFCDAMIAIREEVTLIEEGHYTKSDNPLKNAPHTVNLVASDTWEHSYSREVAFFPTPETKSFKFWPSVGRIDAAYGDKNLVCTCGDVDEYA
jgi:glycine dehydrogenase